MQVDEAGVQRHRDILQRLGVSGREYEATMWKVCCRAGPPALSLQQWPVCHWGLLGGPVWPFIHTCLLVNLSVTRDLSQLDSQTGVVLKRGRVLAVPLVFPSAHRCSLSHAIRVVMALVA
jgi:hypothetical protein